MMSISVNSASGTNSTSPAAASSVQPLRSVAPLDLSATAAGLSTDSAVVASLGGGSASTLYTPSGLLSSLQQAGTLGPGLTPPVAGSNTDTSTLAGNALDQGILSSLAAAPSVSGVYTGSGGLSGMSAQAASNWTDLLKSHPALAGSAISDSLNAALVSTLQVTA